MAQAAAILNTPIEITSNGKQVFLPASSIFFQDGLISAKGPIYTAYKSEFDALLKHQVKAGLIRQGPAPETKPAMLLKAKSAGSNGNSILLQFTNFDASTPAKFDTLVEESNVYIKLKPDDIQKTLGSTATNGARPGLVFVPGAAPAANAVPAAGSYALKVGGGTSATVEIPLKAGSGTAFTLEAKGAGADGEATVVEIKDVDDAAKTFTLLATWTKTVAGTAATGLAAALAYELQVAPPDGAATVGTPVAGTIFLSGGANASDAAFATAAVSGR